MARVEANLAALRTLRAVQSDGRPATVDEQRVLARWSGWGAVPKLFAPEAEEFQQHRAELQDLLTATEYAAARRSTLNAHYTDAALVAPMWNAVTALGLASGARVLEPGCGSGNFLGFAPEGVQLTGVELDPTTAAIASLLYPHAEILNASYADVAVTDGAFDAVVGNVPFGRVRLYDPEHNPDRHPLHTHFTIKALLQAAPGAPVALVVSSWLMDSEDATARQEIADLADLIAAVRLPSGAHQDAAGTQVVTDVLLLRRREPGAPARHAAPWENLTTVTDRRDDVDVQLRVNEYFAERPVDVLGRITSDSGRFGRPYLYVADAPTDIPTALDTLLSSAVTRARDAVLTAPSTADSEREPIQVRVGRPQGFARFEGMITAHAEGGFSRWVGGRWVEHAVPKTQARELRQLIGLRETVQALLAAENATSEDTADINDLRAQLNRRYDAYHAQHGPLNRFSWSTRALPGWTAFGRWCDTHERDKLPADGDTVLDYLRHLRDAGVDRDRAAKHLRAIATRHTAKQVGLTEQVLEQARGIVDSCPDKPHPSVDLVELGLATQARDTPDQGGFRSDPFSSLVRALEIFDPATQTAEKADIFAQRVVTPRAPRTHADSPADALGICLSTHAELRLDVIASLLGLPDADAARRVMTGGEKPLAFLDPATGDVVARNDYLSGDVRAKLRAAETAAATDPALQVNVDSLRPVIPRDLGPEEIEIQLGSWIDAGYVQQFLREILEDPKVRVDHPGARLWVVTGGNPGSTAASSTWGTQHRSAQELTESVLNGREIRITYTDSEGVTHTDAPATEAAKAQAAAISERFKNWVWEDTTRADDLVRVYNDRFNARIPRTYDDIDLTFPGLSDTITLRPHQRTAVAAQIFNPAFGLYHEVGAGKTLEMIVGAMERKRLGLSDRQVFNVPNHMLEQFEREWLQAYPQARLLALSTDSLSGPRKNDVIARLTTGDYDAVILTEGAFRSIPVSPELEQRYVTAEITDIQAALSNAEESDCDQRTVKQLEEMLANAEQTAKAKLDGINRDSGLIWDDLNIDTIVVDESQRFKNTRRFSSLPGMGHPGSDRAVDLDMKLDDLLWRHGHARYISATATPFTNSLAEIYTELNRLSGGDVEDLDTWARTWGELQATLEMVPGGGFKEMTRLRKLINVPELALILRLHADIRTAEDLNLPTPDIAGGGPRIITVPASTELQDFNARLATRYHNIPPRPKKGDDNHLSLIGEGIGAALDLRLVGEHASEPQKVDILADRIYDRWLDTRDNVYHRRDGSEHPTRGALQLVFCSLSTPKPEWNFYDELRDQLVARGMPRHLVRFIHEARNPQQEGEICAAARGGEIAVLVGSSEKMGTGKNVQTRVVAMYQVSPPWRADIPHQELGRGIRQGNQNPVVFVERLVTGHSLEAKKWQVVGQKWDAFRPLMTGRIDTRSIEMPDEDHDHYAELMAAAAGDTRILEKASLESHVNRLTRLHQAWARQQSAHRLTVHRAETDIPNLQASIADLDATIARRDAAAGDFRMTIATTVHTERAPAARHLAQLLETAVTAASKDETQQVSIGEFAGFDLSAEIRLWDKLAPLGLRLDGVAGEVFVDHDDIPTHHGLITRLENWLARLDVRRDDLTKRIEKIREAAEQARPLIGVPFARQEELEDASRRLDALIKELSPTTNGQDQSASTAATSDQAGASAAAGPTTDSNAGTAPTPPAARPDPPHTSTTANPSAPQPAAPESSEETPQDTQNSTVGDSLARELDALLDKHTLTLSETDRYALAQHLHAELADPVLADAAHVNALDQFALLIPRRLTDRFVASISEPSFGESDALCLTLLDNPAFRDDLNSLFARHAHTTLRGTPAPDADTDAQDPVATDDTPTSVPPSSVTSEHASDAANAPVEATSDRTLHPDPAAADTPAERALIRARAVIADAAAKDDDIQAARDIARSRRQLGMTTRARLSSELNGLLPVDGDSRIDPTAMDILVDLLIGAESDKAKATARADQARTAGTSRGTALSLAGLSRALSEYAEHDTDFGALLREVDISQVVTDVDNIADRLATRIGLTLPPHPTALSPSPVASSGQRTPDADQPAATPETDADPAPPAETSHADPPALRVLTLHFSTRHGALLLNTQREDGVGPLLRATRAGWHHRNHIVGPNGEQGAWFLQNTRNRDFSSSNSDRKQRDFHDRVVREITAAGKQLIDAGWTIVPDIHDLPPETAERIHDWHRRVQPRTSTEDTTNGPEPEPDPETPGRPDETTTQAGNAVLDTYQVDPDPVTADPETETSPAQPATQPAPAPDTPAQAEEHTAAPLAVAVQEPLFPEPTPPPVNSPPDVGTTDDSEHRAGEPPTTSTEAPPMTKPAPTSPTASPAPTGPPELPAPGDTWAWVQAFRAAGYKAAIPLRQDGSKGPTVSSWRQYQHQPPDWEQEQAWFRHGHPGIGLLMGAVAGGAEMAELEGRAVKEGLFAQFESLMLADPVTAELFHRITEQGFMVRSPSGGYHMFMRPEGGANRSELLAARPAKEHELTAKERQAWEEHGIWPPRVLAETRGEGSYVTAAGSHGGTHSTGKPWEVIHGTPSSTPTVTAEERDRIYEALRSLDQMPPPPPKPAPAPAREARQDERLKPGEAFNLYGSWEDLLTRNGWTWTGRDGNQDRWARPGSEKNGVCAVTGGNQGPGTMWVFCPNSPLPQHQLLDRFGAFALLEHQGDFSAAAAALRREGYGDPIDAPPRRRLQLTYTEDQGALLTGTARGDGIRNILNTAKEAGSDPGSWWWSDNIDTGSDKSGAWYIRGTRGKPATDPLAVQIATTAAVLRDAGFPVDVHVPDDFPAATTSRVLSPLDLREGHRFTAPGCAVHDGSDEPPPARDTEVFAVGFDVHDELVENGIVYVPVDFDSEAGAVEVPLDTTVTVYEAPAQDAAVAPATQQETAAQQAEPADLAPRPEPSPEPDRSDATPDAAPSAPAEPRSAPEQLQPAGPPAEADTTDAPEPANAPVDPPAAVDDPSPEELIARLNRLPGGHATRSRLEKVGLTLAQFDRAIRARRAAQAAKRAAVYGTGNEVADRSEEEARPTAPAEPEPAADADQDQRTMTLHHSREHGLLLYGTQPGGDVDPALRRAFYYADIGFWKWSPTMLTPDGTEGAWHVDHSRGILATQRTVRALREVADTLSLTGVAVQIDLDQADAELDAWELHTSPRNAANPAPRNPATPGSRPWTAAENVQWHAAAKTTTTGRQGRSTVRVQVAEVNSRFAVEIHARINDHNVVVRLSLSDNRRAARLASEIAKRPGEVPHLGRQLVLVGKGSAEIDGRPVPRTPSDLKSLLAAQPDTNNNQPSPPRAAAARRGTAAVTAPAKPGTAVSNTGNAPAGAASPRRPAPAATRDAHQPTARAGQTL